MGKKITQEEFERRVRAHYGNRFTFLEPYVDTKTRIMRRCNICGDERKVDSSSCMRGTAGCRVCCGHDKKTIEEVQQELDNKFGNKFKIIGSYTGTDDPMEVECLACGYGKEGEWTPTRNNLLKGHGCPNCYGNVRYTQEDAERIIKFEGNGDYVLTDEVPYVNIDTKVIVKHLSCGNKYPVTLWHFMYGNRCPKCASSMGEKRVMRVLEDDLNLVRDKTYVGQKSFDGLKFKKPLRFDFYIPKYNLCIEYDGQQHNHPVELFDEQDPFENRKKRDQLKNDYCKQHHINLLRIPYKYRTYKQIKGKILDYLSTIA